MDDTPNLALPYIMAAQAQKHVTHNEAIRALDALVQLTVLDRDLSAPPASPGDGARFIVGSSPTGAWAGQANNIAAWQDGAWAFYAPLEGWLAWIADENVLLCYDGASWTPAVSLQNVPMLGINATADATNRLAVSAAATLFNHAGAGHQVKVNKNAAADTASFLFQTGLSGRAEFGTTGDDKFHFKVSPDGAAWKEGFVIDPATGYIGIGTTAPDRMLHVLASDGFGAAIERCDDNVSGAVWTYRKARGTPASKTTVQTGDTIQGAFGLGYDGSTYIGCCNLRWVVDGAVSTGVVPTRIEFWTFTSGVGHSAKLEVKSNGATRPAADNAYTLGDSTNRWSAVWAANGTIQTSDARDKDVLGALGFAGALIDAVDPVLFRWKVGGNQIVRAGEEPDPDDPGKMRARVVARPKPGKRVHAGFLAQEIKAAMDAAGADFAAWGLDDAADPASRQWTRPDQLIAVLWAALKETRAEVRKLQQR